MNCYANVFSIYKWKIWFLPILKLVLQFSQKERNYRHGYGNKLYANDFA